MPPSIGLANNSLRQPLRVSIGGDTVRLRLTNEYTQVPVTLNAVTIAVSNGAGTIDTLTRRPLKFSGKDSITMAAGAYVWSDPLAFTLTPQATLQVTLYFGSAPAPTASPNVTGHRGSRFTARILAGNHVNDASFSGATTIVASYVISSLEVKAPQSAGAVAILGNSLTDGYGTTTDGYNRWTDVFATNLLAHARTSKVGVLNAGIGAGNMLSGGISTPGLQRYKRDLFDQAGVKWIIILLGVNDIGASTCNTTISTNMIAAYTQIADSAHARGIKVYGSPITPFGGNGYYSASNEACRQAINTWVRTNSKYDAVIDFDKLLRNPSDTTKMRAAYDNDHLHPNVAGYALMGNSVDTSLFIESGTNVKGAVAAPGWSLSWVGSNAKGALTARFTVPSESFVSLKVWSLQGKQVAEMQGRSFAAGEHSVTFGAGRLKVGAYLVTLKSAGHTVTRKLVLSEN